MVTSNLTFGRSSSFLQGGNPPPLITNATKNTLVRQGLRGCYTVQSRNWRRSSENWRKKQGSQNKKSKIRKFWLYTTSTYFSFIKIIFKITLIFEVIFPELTMVRFFFFYFVLEQSQNPQREHTLVDEQDVSNLCQL